MLRFPHLALALLSLPSTAAPAEWSTAALEQARRSDRPVLLVVNDASCEPCAAAERAASAALADRMARDFVVISVDRLVRPDLADVYGLAVRELGGGDGFPVLVAVTPDGTPYAGRAGPSALDTAALEAFATEALAGFRTARSGLDARALAVKETLRAAQTPSAPKGPLDAATVDAAIRAVVGWSELGRADGPLPHAAIRFLLAEHARTRRPELLKLATATLDLRLARGPSSPADTVAEEAERLETWTLAYAASDLAAYRAEAALAADRLIAARVAGGLFPARLAAKRSEPPVDATVVAQTNGLAIGALALSARTLGREADRDAAVKAAALLRSRFGDPTALARVEGGPGGAYLDDYAALLTAYLELYETTDDVRWRGEAQAVAEAAIGRFADVGAGGFFLTDAAHEPLPVRVKHAFDGALPSANGTMALALARLSRATGEPRYAELGRRTVEAFLGDLQRVPRGLLTLARSAGESLGPVTAHATGPAPLAARETRGPVTLEARAPASVRAGASFEATLALTIAPGSFVVARSAGAIDLATLGISVPFDGARSAMPRPPEARTRTFSWSAQPVAVYEGTATVPIAVTLTPKVETGDRALRVRVLFQACGASRCERPESVTLEVPVRVEAAR